jgi:hypothetical protein
MLIDRHCGKARYDFSERLGQLVRNYQLNLTEAVRSRQNDVLKALEAGIASKQNAAIETKAQKTRIGDKIKNLKEIKESLQKLIIRL